MRQSRVVTRGRGDRTQEQIAADIRQGDIIKFERGARPNPPLATAMRLARALGVELDAITD